MNDGILKTEGNKMLGKKIEIKINNSEEIKRFIKKEDA